MDQPNQRVGVERRILSDGLWVRTILLWIGLVLSVFLTNEIAARFLRPRALFRFSPQSQVGFLRPKGYRAVYVGQVSWTIALAVVAIVAWLVWQYDAASVARRLSARPLRFSPWFGILAWAIPVANVVLPPIVHGELLLRSNPEEGAGGRPRRWPLTLVVVWWGLLVTAMVFIVRAVVFFPSGPGTDFRHNHHRDHLLKTGGLFLLLAGIAAVAMITWISVRLSRREMRVKSLGRSQVWMRWRGRTAGPEAGEG